MVSVCLPSDALLRHLPSYLGFSYLGRGVSLHGCSSDAQLLLLTLDEGYLLTAALPDLQCGIAPLGPPAPVQPRLFGHGVSPPGRSPWPQSLGGSSWPLPLASGMGWLLPATPDLRRGVAPLGHSWTVAAWQPSAFAPDLGCGVPGSSPAGSRVIRRWGWSRHPWK